MKYHLIFWLAFFLVLSCQGQVGVFTENPHPSSILEVRASNNKGVLIPRLSGADKMSISNPARGLLVYDTDIDSYAVYDGTSWVDLAPVPSGTITMWSGSINQLPEGWVLCDGRRYNLDGTPNVNSTIGKLTPDLRDRFVVGYDEHVTAYDQPYSDIGGLDRVRLDISEMPTHTHNVVSDHSHSMLISQSEHFHDIVFFTAGSSMNNDSFVDVPNGVSTRFYTVGTSNTFTDVVTNTITSSNAGSQISVGSTGSGEAHENRPPFYVVAFIMKL